MGLWPSCAVGGNLRRSRRTHQWQCSPDRQYHLLAADVIADAGADCSADAGAHFLPYAGTNTCAYTIADLQPDAGTHAQPDAGTHAQPDVLAHIQPDAGAHTIGFTMCVPSWRHSVCTRR